MKKVIAMVITASMMTTNLASVTALGTDVKVQNKDELNMSKEVVKQTSRKIDFTKDWKFNLGSVDGAESTNFDDSSWRNLDLPHDWSIELDFNPNSAATHEGGYLDGGTAWYRKSFVLDDEMKGKNISIDFDGVYMESEIYVNGTKVGEYQNGYTPFSFDISKNLKFNGEENIIAVKVVNRQPSSRWYSGSGIYRNVYLTSTDEVHVDRYGTFVTTPTIEEDLKNGNKVNVNVKTEVKNTKSVDTNAIVRSKIYSPTGELVTEVENVQVLKPGINDVIHDLQVKNPMLWKVYEGNMYNVVTEIEVENEVIDTYDTPFGFRYFEFTENDGFSLNGEWMKLNGVCMHSDLGALGSAINEDAIERQVKKLKEMGVNAIRLTHNPTSNEFLEVCEREGILLIDEAFDSWAQSKKPYDYGRFFNQYAKRDIQEMVDRGKNSPAIIAWSIGNEIYDTNNSSGVEIAKNLVKWIKEIDTTRPTTIGEDKYRGGKVDDVPNWNQYRDQVFETVDVVGYNYSENVYDVHHEAKPDWKMYGAETSSAVRSRGIYLDPQNPNISDWENLQTSSYDNSVVGWGRSAEDSIKRDRDRKFIAGQFIWTGFDYIGEPTPFYNSYPAKSSYFGAIDTAGFEKDIFYFYQSQWTKEPMVHLLPHWNWEEGENIKVWAYSNVDTVELFLNGESIGERSFENKTTNYGLDYLETQDGKLHLEWDVPFEEGTIKAVAKKDGVVVAEDEITTAGKAAAIEMEAETSVIKSDGKSLSFIEVDVVDEKGNFVPTADNLIEFEVTGGEIVGVDNGNAASVERYKDNKRKAFSGKALVIVQSDETEGEITVKATSKGLDSDSTTVIKVDSNEGIEEKIVGFEPVDISITKGEEIQLPTEAIAIYGNNTKAPVDVEWNDIKDGMFDNIGSYSIEGSVKGTDIKVKATVVVRDIIGVKNYSTVTAVGQKPALPKEIAIVYSDGKEVLSPVNWDEIDPENYSKVGNYVVEGTVNGAQQYKTQAHIRVTDETINENIALSSSLSKGTGIASQTGSGDSTLHLNDGVISFNNSPKNRWTNWPATSSDWAGIEWSEEKTFDNMNLYVYADSGCQAPTSLVVEYFDGENWLEVSNMKMTPEVATNNTKHEITFDAVTTSKIRVNMNPQPGKSLALTEIEIFADVISANESAELESILVDGKEIEGFNKDVTEYELVLPYGSEIPVISATSAHNGTEFVLPTIQLPGETKITVVSEDGKNQKIYTVKFKMEDAYLNNVEIKLDNLNVNEDDLVDFNIEATLINGEKVDLKNTKIEYFTSDKNVVDFRNGQLAVVGGGTAQIYVEVTYKDIKVTSNKLTINSNPSLEEKIIVGLKPINITTTIGVEPILPETIMAKFNVGLEKERNVIWDKIDPANYENYGTFEVYGSVEGTSIKAIANIEVKGEIASQNISVATLVGEKPELPTEINVYYSDKTESKLQVVWGELTNEQLSTPGEYDLTGTIEGSNLIANAKIRVSNESEQGLNISRFQNGYDYPRTAASYSNEPPADAASKDRLAHINNDIISFNDSPHDRWTNWKRTPDQTGWVSVEFGRTSSQEYYVDEVFVNYFTDAGVKMPESAIVQYKDGDQWYDVKNQTQSKGEFENTVVYKFDKVKTSQIRLFMNAASGKSLGITELQIFKNDVIKKSNSKVSQINLDENLIDGFNSEILNYEVDLIDEKIPTITAKADDNASITIVPATSKTNNVAKIIVTSEDGVNQNIYEIKFNTNKEVSKQVLKEKIEEGSKLLSGNYTDQTLALLQIALEEGKLVNDNNMATQYEVDSAVALINDAISRLVSKEQISLDDLKALLEVAKSFNQEDYTSSSFENLANTIKTVESIINSENLTDKQIKEAYIELEAAIKNLENKKIVVSKISKLKAKEAQNSIELTWKEPNETYGLVEYIIYKDSKEVARVPVGTSSYNVENLKNNTIYSFKVVSSYIDGSVSAPVSKSARTLK